MCKKRSVTEHTEETDEDPPEGTPLKKRVALPRPMHVKAGQYVSLWIPSASFSSWLQCHSFTVTSWSPGKEDVLELFVQTRRGQTEKLRARASLEGMTTFTASVIGTYGRSEPVGVVPYIKRLLYGYNTSSARVRRVHLVWQVQTKDIAVAAQPLLNSLLDDDVLDDGFILEMSFYVEYKSIAGKGRPFGEHRRAIIYDGFPGYDNIISAEASGQHINRVSNTQEEMGKLLVMVSAKDEVRDLLTVIVRKYIDQGVELRKVEFQPS
ncbi:hypothetical protein KXW98_002022 [Aspergillus fumigatus]|nr:hypothetical protein KXX10_000380 [Aspergillus fumigatus]KAH2362895.1 hypothetical protein KXV41_004236 [Aspergillus fumigatus]KAH2403283.1 hypothetical protein KXW64_002300 [Aspergillus fumigatus]KAH3040656.1 hypothetical protein KXW83_008628 [Aspergillus fumigatus]KAH3488348.1 hypothetical protein KXW98_002022 [Aspergillus fumigatus]